MKLRSSSISGWTGLRYLQDWTELANSFDIATLLALDGKWQQLEKIRIFMGDETTRRTRSALLESLRTRAKHHLNGSIENNKDKNPFLKGVSLRPPEVRLAEEKIDFRRTEDHEQRVKISIQNVAGWRE